MASQLNDMSGNLKSGCIIEIPMFQILKYLHDNNDIQHSIILCTKLNIIGFDAKLVEMCKLKVAIDEVSSSNNSIIMKKEDKSLKENETLKHNYCNKCEGDFNSIPFLIKD